MAETAVVNSGSDLAAMAPPDLFSSAPEMPADTGDSSESSEETEVFDTPEPIEEPTPEPEPEPEPEPVAEEIPAEPVAAAAPTEELPEGVVRGKDRNGKQGLFVEDGRWKNIYGNHQLVQKVSEMLGEPATAEALQLRNDAYLAQERLFSDLTSGDPKSQGAVVDYFLDEMARARETGEVGIDPSVPLAQTFYSSLREKSPDGYATLRLSAARDLMREIYQEASASGDESLYLSAQHVVRALANIPKGVTDVAQIRTAAQRLGLPFYTKAEMGTLKASADPVLRLQAENARLNSIVNGKSPTNQAAQFDAWYSGVAASVKSGVLDDAVRPALASVEAAWKPFPSDYQDLVVDRLHRKVTETLRADTGFNQRIGQLNAQAARATSAQRRDEIAQTIQQAYVNRAKLAVDAVKKPILEFAASRLKERADQNHARRDAAQNRTAPKGAAGTVPRSLTPNNLVQMKDGIFDPAVAVKQARQLLFGG